MNDAVIACVVGARPNFMKMGPVVLELMRRGLRHELIHTGQHYDPNMSEVFFTELGLPRPDVYLEVGSGTHATQTAAVMIALEKHWSDGERFARGVGAVAGVLALVVLIVPGLAVGLSPGMPSMSM